MLSVICHMTELYYSSYTWAVESYTCRTLSDTISALKKTYLYSKHGSSPNIGWGVGARELCSRGLTAHIP